MSGHSKWHSIRHKKGANDAKRGKVLTKYAKIIMIIAKDNPDPQNNPALRVAIANAKSDGVPKDNIERILKKISGNDDKNNIIYNEQLYEGFTPEGVPILVQALTENVNRTFPEVKTAFTKNGGRLGDKGSVSFMFDHLGIVEFSPEEINEDQIFELATEVEAENFSWSNEYAEISTNFKDLARIRDLIIAKGEYEIKKVQPIYRIKTPQEIDENEIEELNNFIEKIEEVDDVDEIFLGI